MRRGEGSGDEQGQRGGTDLGTLSNDNCDGNEDGKKAIGLDWQNNNFAVAARI